MAFFLANISFNVKIENDLSSESVVITVGDILGPLLFKIYTAYALKYLFLKFAYNIY